MPLQLTKKITYGYPVDDMLNSTKRITDKLKWLIFFWRAWSIYKAIGNFINDELTDRPELVDECFFLWTVSICDSIGKIITNRMLV
jgi:hypothetical protein